MKAESEHAQDAGRTNKVNTQYEEHQLYDLAQVAGHIKEVWHVSENLEQLLESLLKNGGIRRLQNATENTVAGIMTLREQYPNFNHLLDWIEGRCRLCAFGGRHFSMPPINLDGEPGIGKTQFVAQLSKVLGLEIIQVPVGSMHGRFELVGGNPQWRGATIGAIAKGMLRCETANPVMFLDELCMVRDTEEESMVQPLYQLLEDKQRSHFHDNYLDVYLDIGQANIITTTNDYSRLRPALQSRLLNFRIPNPSPAQMRGIVQSLYQQMRGDPVNCGVLESSLSTEIVRHLVALSPREAKKHLAYGVNRAIFRGIPDSGMIRIQLQDLPPIESIHHSTQHPTFH